MVCLIDDSVVIFGLRFVLFKHIFYKTRISSKTCAQRAKKNVKIDEH